MVPPFSMVRIFGQSGKKCTKTSKNLKNGTLKQDYVYQNSEKTIKMYIAAFISGTPSAQIVSLN